MSTTSRNNKLGRAMAAFAVLFLLVLGVEFSHAAEDDLIGILSSPPLTGIGKFNDRLRMDPARYEVGTATVAPGGTTGVITFSTTAYDTSYNVFLTPTTLCTPSYYVATITNAYSATITLGAAAGITNTFQYLRLDR